MANLRSKLGDFGEQVALGHLARQGYRLEARKWRCALGELDLVMRDGPALVFVEVRTRRSDRAGLAAESVGAAKQRRLSGLAYAYCEAEQVPAQQPWRIDVITVDVDRAGRVAGLQHIPNAIEEG